MYKLGSAPARLGSALAAATLLATPAAAATVIDTNPSPTTTTCCFGFNGSSINLLGQTFTVPTDNLLESFDFTLETGSHLLDFVGEIHTWNSVSQTIGATALYTSDTQSYTGPTAQTFHFDTNALALTSGDQYMALMRPLGSPGDQASAGSPNSPTSTYAGGGLFFRSAGNTSFVSLFGDGQVELTFDSASPSSAAPEPMAWALMVIGFAGAGSVLRRRRAHAAFR